MKAFVLAIFLFEFVPSFWGSVGPLAEYDSLKSCEADLPNHVEKYYKLLYADLRDNHSDELALATVKSFRESVPGQKVKLLDGSQASVPDWKCLSQQEFLVLRMHEAKKWIK